MLLLLASPPRFIEELRQALFDGYQRVFPRERENAPAVVVEIDELALAKYGQWPWPRTLMADLVERISSLGARAIGFDVLFMESDRYSPGVLGRTLTNLPEDVARRLSALPSNDARFAQSMRGRGVVLAISGDDEADTAADARLPGGVPVRYAGGAERSIRRFNGHLGNIAILDHAAAGRGMISVDASDTSVRRARLLAEIGGSQAVALALESLRIATETPELNVGFRSDGLLDIGLGDVRIPVQEDGIFWIYFSRRNHPAQCERCVSAADVLGARIASGTFTDKIALIGLSGLGLLDYKITPFGEKVPGVELHAQIVEQIFDSSYLIRPRWTGWLELVVLALGGLALMLIVPRRRVAVSLAVLASMLALLAITGLLAFRAAGVLLDVAWPGIGIAVVFAFLLTGALSDAQRQRHALREAAARVAGELEAARRIQMGLLPRPREVFRGEHRFDLEALLEPARSVGGDFYDCFKLDEHRLLFIAGDVSGKGMPAALFMALSMSLIRSAAVRGRGSIGAIVSQAAADIEPQNAESLFVTLFAGILDLRNGILEFCNAGHPSPYARQPDGTIEDYPPAGGPPLCVLSNFDYPTDRRQLHPGEWLCVVTDGITEATNQSNSLYGTERLRAAIASLRRGVDAKEFALALRRDVERFADGASLSDDLTLLVVRWRGDTEGSAV